MLAPVALQSLHAGTPQLSRDDVETILAQAASKASSINPNALIAVTDREGFVLGVWDVRGRIPNPLPAFGFGRIPLNIYGEIAGAVSRAGTAAYLSSNENAFTSRTAGFIIQQHFPPGVRNTPPGPLVGVGFSNLFYSDINRFKQIPPGFNSLDLNPAPGNPFSIPDPFTGKISGGIRGNPVLLTSLNDAPGGLPLYKGGNLVGGIGVVGDKSVSDLSPAAAILLGVTQKSSTPGFKAGTDTDEEVALAGQTNFRPPGEILATNVLINGIRVPYVGIAARDIKDVEDVVPLGRIGRPVAGFPVQAPPPPFPYEVGRFGGFEGEIRAPLRDDPLSRVKGRELINKVGRLTRNEVEEIIIEAAQRARITRAGIRLPLGTSMKCWIVVVNNPNRAGDKPVVLGTFRTGEAPLFSWDVAAQKARSALFFSNRQLAVSSRTIGFISQSMFPPGLDGRPRGPFFGFQEAVTFRRLLVGADANQLGRVGFPGNPNLPNGLTIFPGGFPLYRDGVLIGAIGVSGDGVDQDDIVGSSGTKDFQADPKIRADQYTLRGARLPYAKFPRDPVR